MKKGANLKQGRMKGIKPRRKQRIKIRDQSQSIKTMNVS